MKRLPQEQALQVARVTKIIDPGTDDTKYPGVFYQIRLTVMVHCTVIMNDDYLILGDVRWGSDQKR